MAPSIDHPVRPRVRVVVLNFDGGDMTTRCLESVLVHAPADANLELMMVDNASVDGVIRRVRHGLPSVRIVESLENLGFAGGCNLGMTDLDEFDFVALLNNDAYVEGPWLDELLAAAAAADSSVGAWCPKLVFADRVRAVDIDVVARRPEGPDSRLLGVRLSGVRVDGIELAKPPSFDEQWWGLEQAAGSAQWSRWSKGSASVRLAESITSAPVEFRLSAVGPVSATIRSGPFVSTVELDSTPRWVPVELDPATHRVINNVGSNVYRHGYGGDRGFLEMDKGQYEVPFAPFAWCGGAVPLRSAYLKDVGLFDERFFLYYEDTDLSWRGRLAGWTYSYVPSAVVCHEHAVTSGGENSPVFRFHVDRNRVLMMLKCAPALMATRALWELTTEVVQLYWHHVVVPRFGRRRGDDHLASLRLRSWRSAVSLLPAMMRDRRQLRRTARLRPSALRQLMVDK